MRLTGAQIAVRALEDEGIPFAFGIPGTHNIELYDALADSKTVRTILITDEQSAGFLADAVWRSSGRMACANLVPGAGLTHALSGIAEAFMDGIPMLVLGCGIRRDTDRAYQLHDIDQLAVARPITKGTFRPTEGRDLYRTIRDACALARSGTPGPVMVEVPVNLYLFQSEFDPEATGDASLPVPVPDPAALDRAAALLAEPGSRPLLYVGLGARGAGAALVRLAERLGAPVATTIQGKGVFPESHPLFLWNGFGDAAPPFVREIVAQCNRTVAIGVRFSEVGTGSYSSVPPVPLIHCDINPEVIDRNFAADVPIVGDAATVVAALLSRLPATTAAANPAIVAGRAKVRHDQLARESPDGVAPARLLAAIQERLGAETIYTTDSGNGTFVAMEGLVLDQPGKFLAPVDYSCMGYAVPAAIGAKLAMPDAPVVALVGDGALLMTGLELLTAVHYQVPIAVFVLRDRELAQIAQFQRTAMHRTVASALPDYHAGGLAEALGAEWIELEQEADLGAVLDRVVETTGSGRPILVDVAIDYSEKTFFTRGVVRTNFLRLPWKDRLRFVARAVGRRLGL